MLGCWVPTKYHFPSQPKFYKSGSHKDVLVCSHLYGKGKMSISRDLIWTCTRPICQIHLWHSIFSQPVMWHTECKATHSTNGEHMVSSVKDSSSHSSFHNQGTAHQSKNEPLGPRSLWNARVWRKMMILSTYVELVWGCSNASFGILRPGFRFLPMRKDIRMQLRSKSHVSVGQGLNQKKRVDLGT